ncbi:serine/threonine-protein kinase [Streptomyces sp. NPDC093707]|uniref:serine/threonine-protein kinase n=1 Tax=Streptomyces sp. NPDC093707 TaxID=3154984 RepID=UPI00344F371C
MEQPGRTGQQRRAGGLGGLAPLGAHDPQQIGDYRLLGRLGEGGMGRVFLARSDRGRTVAVKLVRAELAHQEEFRDRFRREVRAARKVGGEWTAPVLDADTGAETPWVATGYIAGPSLQQVVARNGPLPERTVRILAAGLARALRSVHAAGIIHRDLKPSNVLLTIDGPRVIDFGIARALEGVTTSVATHTGSPVGSPGFMAPEQVRGEPLTPACDVFCLGSVLVYAATGRQPFGSATTLPHAMMYRIAEEEPDLTALPAGLHELIADCLAKDPARRPTPEELVARAADADADGAADDEPWLPGTLIARLGRHAVELLEAEDPQDGTADRTSALPTAGQASAAAATVASPAAPARRRRTGRTLLAAAVVALVGAGAATAYTLLGSPNGSAAAIENATGRTPAADGAIPAGYLGIWSTTVGDSALDVRRFTLVQGKPGETVLRMQATGPTYDCRFVATLKSAGPPVRLGPSTVVSGPPDTCRPGSPSTLELIGGQLRRTFDQANGLAPLLYAKKG